MKIAVLNDTHCGCRSSSDIFIEYQERFYTEVFFPYLKKHGIKNIIHLGDYYEDRKRINVKAMNANRKHFLDVLKSEGISMDIIPGNHDVFYKSTNEMCTLKELLGYYTNNVNIVMKPQVLEYDGLSIGLLPWINQENTEESMKFLANCKADWIAGHLELTGFEMMKGVLNSHGMDPKPFDRFDTVLSGHFHTKSSKGNIHYLGSQMEFTWADADDPKYFHVIDTDKKDFTPVRNPLTIFQKLTYTDELDTKGFDYTDVYKKFVKLIVTSRKDSKKFDQFVDKLENSGIHELKIADSFDEFRGSNVDDEDVSVTVEDTPKLLDAYVDSVETDLDKDKMKVMMRELYVEASNQEVV